MVGKLYDKTATRTLLASRLRGQVGKDASKFKSTCNPRVSVNLAPICESLAVGWRRRAIDHCLVGAFQRKSIGV